MLIALKLVEIYLFKLHGNSSIKHNLFSVGNYFYELYDDCFTWAV